MILGGIAMCALPSELERIGRFCKAVEQPMIVMLRASETFGQRQKGVAAFQSIRRQSSIGRRWPRAPFVTRSSPPVGRRAPELMADYDALSASLLRLVLRPESAPAGHDRDGTICWRPECSACHRLCAQVRSISDGIQQTGSQLLHDSLRQTPLSRELLKHHQTMTRTCVPSMLKLHSNAMDVLNHARGSERNKVPAHRRGRWMCAH